MPGFLLPYHILSLLLLASCQVVDVIISQSQPETAVYVSPSIMSLSIEGDRWTNWVETTKGIPNNFFRNTLANLQGFTGEPTRIRIGANSADNTFFGGNILETYFPKASIINPYPEATNVTVDDTYYKAAQFLPPNTLIAWGVNLKSNNLPATLLETITMINAFSSPSIKNAGILLDAIEIGNEADLYSSNGARPQTYTVAQYVSEWNQFAGMIALTQQSVKFWGASFSSITGGFSPRAIFEEGITSSLPGSLISSISQHHYSCNFCTGKKGDLEDLMNKAYIRSNLTQFAPDIAATIKRGLVYMLGETNSCACHGTPGVSNTAGAALWMVDYLLFATQLGISRLYFHEGIGFKYNLIQPVALDRSTLDAAILRTPLLPHIQPQYYAAIIIAEAIGNSNNTQVIELYINEPTISGYAFYQGGKLTKAILINSEAYFTTTRTARPSTQVNLIFEGSPVPSEMTVKRLSVQHADDISGLTWGGQTYETVDGKVRGNLEISTEDVSSGVDIEATSVVMLSFL